MNHDDKIYNQVMRLERGIAFLHRAAREFDLGNLQIECWEIDMVLEKREAQLKKIVYDNYPKTAKGRIK